MSERKRRQNLARHGIDFVDAPAVFEGPTYTFEDNRFECLERRYATLGLRAGIVVSIVHMETLDEIRIISFGKATIREQEIYFAQIRD